MTPFQPSSLNIQYGYDFASRLETVSQGDLTATYSYLANSPLWGQIAFKQNSTTRMTTTRQHDFLNRLTGISSVSSVSSVVNFGYTYNDANQRTNVTLGPDGSYWAYSYDSLGQVTSGKKYWRDGVPVAGQQFEYTFDDIGNRKQTKAGGGASGQNLRVAAYTNNLLNQLTGREVPGTNDIIGLAHASATVTVNGQSPYRRGEYFWKELPVTNNLGVVFQGVTNQAVLAGSTNPSVGNLLTPQRGQGFWHDSDGNLLSDGVWTNTWDAENRIIATESAPGLPTAAKAKETWSYYADGRWKERVQYTWTNSQYQAVATNRFIWDGNVILAIVNHTNGLLQGFMRGLDLSGTPQGAGGAGGLLALVTSANGSHFYCFDGNGNVAALISATNSTETARYEYGPFGETIRATGPMARENSFRFSSQFADDITRRLKYLHRDYDPPTGRWTSRDPIAEHGGRHLYSFCANDPGNHLDVNGENYYVTRIPAFCGVPHVVIFGDDGEGHHYRIDLVPVTDHWWQALNRFCGKGRIDSTPGQSTAWDAFSRISDYTLIRTVESSREWDRAFAAAAKNLNGREVTYCVLTKNCRAVEDCLLTESVGHYIAQQMLSIWEANANAR